MIDHYRSMITGFSVPGKSETDQIIRRELQLALTQLLDRKIESTEEESLSPILIAGTPNSSKTINSLAIKNELAELGDEGYCIRTVPNRLIVASNGSAGTLYGMFHLLRLIQTGQNLNSLNIKKKPAIKRRMLNHWDNLDGSVERGYAGQSIWKWDKLPRLLTVEYRDYARACASIGINSMVPNNVNASSESLSADYLEKLKALADVFRPYNIRVYLTAKFSAPIDLGGLKDASPISPDVINWWNAKVDEIYQYIPDFGGFLVKANSEGQPGPQDYNCSHADGANLLAGALDEHGGVVMWRAFVYDQEVDKDRVKRQYKQMQPLDGQFAENVFIQIKNGPLDFQPLEPVSPLFGAMPNTKCGMEFQITQEYLGFSTHLVYLAPMWKDTLEFDTYAKGDNSNVYKVVDGTLFSNSDSLIAGVSNIGNDRNWTGHHFAQANWYAFGRLAWDPKLSPESIAREWLAMTWDVSTPAGDLILEMMMKSHKAAHSYFTPLGLTHLQDGGHYDPKPSMRTMYHLARKTGIGVNRTKRGSDFVSQYKEPVANMYNDRETCPENLLLWFHHLPWDYKMKSGRTLLEELHYQYDSGVSTVRTMIESWQSIRDEVDPERHKHVLHRLNDQYKHAQLWRDTCLKYFDSYTQTQ